MTVLHSKDPELDLHIFSCINERPADDPKGRGSCAGRGAIPLQNYLKLAVKKIRGVSIRANKSGCLDVCELGPVMVIYPEGIWYSFKTEADIDEIIKNHILGGEPVERLRIASKSETPDSLQLRVAAVEKLTNKINGYELVAQDGSPLPEFSAGSHIDIITDPENSGGHLCSYSIASSPLDKERYVLAVLKEDSGNGGSDWMHRVTTGDIVTTSSPRNNFHIRQEATSHIFLAGGVGITPVLSMGYQLQASGGDMHLHFCTKSLEETAFIDEVRDVFGGNVTFYHDGGDPAKGIDLAQVLGDRPEGAHLYLCGPAGLIQAAQNITDNSGKWPEGTVHFEYFQAPDDTPVDLSADDAFDVVLSKTGKQLTIAQGQTILEALRDAGVVAASSCENGFCGTCSVPLLGGKADHRDFVQEDSEKTENSNIMLCLSRALPGETLILDI